MAKASFRFSEEMAGAGAEMFLNFRGQLQSEPAQPLPFSR
jgi:hypothetical protein